MDFALVNLCMRGDIVVTQDYGVAAMILGKGAYGIHQNGRWYTNENIDRMLMERHIAKKARRAYLAFISSISADVCESILGRSTWVSSAAIRETAVQCYFPGQMRVRGNAFFSMIK